MKKILLFAILLLLSLSISQAMQDLDMSCEDEISGINKKDEEIVYKLFERSVKSAQSVELGKSDTIELMDFIRTQPNHGNLELYLDDFLNIYPTSSQSFWMSTAFGIQKEYKKAFKYALWYANHGEKPFIAQNIVGQMYMMGIGVKKDITTGFDYIKKSADNGYTEAQFVIGFSFMNGVNVKKDEKEALKYFNELKFKDNKNGDIDYYLYKIYTNKDNDFYNEDSGLIYLNMSAKKAYKDAINELKTVELKRTKWNVFQSGNGIIKEPPFSFKYPRLWKKEKGFLDAVQFLYHYDDDNSISCNVFTFKDKVSVNKNDFKAKINKKVGVASGNSPDMTLIEVSGHPTIFSEGFGKKEPVMNNKEVFEYMRSYLIFYKEYRISLMLRVFSKDPLETKILYDKHKLIFDEIVNSFIIDENIVQTNELSQIQKIISDPDLSDAEKLKFINTISK